MSLIRTIPLVIDIDSPSATGCVFGLDAGGRPSGFAVGAAIVLVAGDYVCFRLYFWSSARALNLRLSGTYQIVIAGAAQDDEGTILFEGDSFVEVNVGSEEAPVWAYDLEVSLDTQAMASAIGEESPLVAETDIEVSTATAENPMTIRIRPTILAQVYVGGTPPDPSEPAYPAPASIVTKLRGTVAIPEGDTLVAVSGLGLGGIPAQVLLSLRKPTAGAPQLGDPELLDDTVTADAFSFELGAAPEVTGYSVDYLIIL